MDEQEQDRSEDPVVTLNTARFRRRPDEHVVAVLPADAVEGAASALSRSGIKPGTIEVLLGEEGRAILDVTGTQHGVKGSLVRLLQRAGPAGVELTMYDGALQHGDAVAAVQVPDGGRARAVGHLLRQHRAMAVQFFNGNATEPV